MREGLEKKVGFSEIKCPEGIEVIPFEILCDVDKDLADELSLNEYINTKN